ncbi:MAG: hypothetical protein GXP26_08720 [Planctomycetes bacterium]|nr:hypothetical protein [Planctomycetota bacterium]
MFAKRFPLATALALLVAFSLAPIAVAGELRIETDVYLGDETESLNHTVTLFDSGTVYDFVEKPAQIAVFRPPTSTREGQFILLDLESKRRTEVSTKRIAGLMKKLTQWASDHEDPLLKFSANPEFKTTFNKESGELNLTSETWIYRVATVEAEDRQTLARYREFTDWYTRLNTMMNGAPPPGPRLKLNAALEEHGVVPVEIHRTVSSQSTEVRATHLFSWRLSREDRARLEEARRHLANFKKVDNEAFLAVRAGKDLVRGQSR